MYKHVLIATDGSELAQKGVDHGLALAKVLGATASIVVVSELFTGPVLADGADIGLMTTAAELRHELERSAEALLKSVGEQAERMGVPCETVHVADRRAIAAGQIRRRRSRRPIGLHPPMPVLRRTHVHH